MTTIHYHTFGDLARYVVALRPPRLVVVDGAGGSGKSVFAARLMTATEKYVKTVIVSVDDFYRPAGERTSEFTGLFNLGRLRSEVIEPYVSGKRITYRPYDWEIEAVSSKERTAGHADVLIVEGVFALSTALAWTGALGVWVDAPMDLRLARGLERDGEAARDVWVNDWIPREDAYRREERPEARAHLTVDTSAPLADDLFLCRDHGTMDLRALPLDDRT